MSLGSVLDDLEAAVDKCRSVVWANQSGPALLEAAEQLQRVRNKLDAVDAEALAALDASKEHREDGQPSVGAWLAKRCRVRRGTGNARVHLGRRLRAMPHTAEALSAGEITAEHAQVLVKANVAARAEAFAESEELLVGFARDLSFADFVRAVRYWCDLADPDDAERQAQAEEESRSLHASVTFEGTTRLDGTLDRVRGHVFRTELERIERELWEADWAEARERLGDAARESDLRRSAAQRRADALVEMAKRSRESQGAREPVWVGNLVMDWDTYLTQLHRLGAETAGEDPNAFPYPCERVCELDDGTILTPGQALAMILEGWARRLVLGAGNVPLDYGDKIRFPTPDLRKAVELAHRHCKDCDVPANKCQIDHQLEYSAGGPTNAANLVPRCEFHNKWKEILRRRERERRRRA